MKKILLALVIIGCLVSILPVDLWAAGSCTQAPKRLNHDNRIVIVFTCTGDSSDGSIPDTAISTTNMNLIYDKFLYTVTAYATPGGTAPDAADVFVIDGTSEDLLGSSDGGTTAAKGANLIHATLTNTTLPYSNFMKSYYYPPVKNVHTLRVSNQGTASANYTIELDYEK